MLVLVNRPWKRPGDTPENIPKKLTSKLGLIAKRRNKMKYSPEALESMIRWQVMHDKNHKKSREMIEIGNLEYATAYQELQAMCFEAARSWDMREEC